MNTDNNLTDKYNDVDFRMPERTSHVRTERITRFFQLLAVTLVTISAVNVPAQSTKTQPQRVGTQSSGASAVDSQKPLAGRITYADIVEKVAPAVVTVRSERKILSPASNLPRDDNNQPPAVSGKMPEIKKQQMERSLGSGVIIGSDGIIITNNHVIEGASLVKVDLTDKRTFTARIVGMDPASDLAVLKIEATNLPVLVLGNSDAVRVGDAVLAIGNPLGLSQTVTSGIISAKGRQTGLSNGGFEDFLQTDASINDGNSGGALVNLNGELIGINSELLSPTGGSIGIGFAIPSNMARSVSEQLLKDGKVHRGMLGIGTQNVTSDLAEDFGLKEIRGVIVNSVLPGGPADRGGLKLGDVITSFDGKQVVDGNEVRNKIAQTLPGTEVSLGYIRNGGFSTVKLTLGEFSATIVDDDNASGSETASDRFGLVLEQLTPQIAALIGDKKLTRGLIVADVESGSPGDDAGIVPGDVILEINRQSISTVEEINKAVAKTNKSSALLLVSRDGQTYFITVAM
ncbi:MAG: DegQ family serine endoprotease [Acidobacteriota bacterium]